MNLSRNLLIVLLVIVFVGGAGTAYAGVILPTITLGGNVDILGQMTCTNCVDSGDIANGAILLEDLSSEAKMLPFVFLQTISSSISLQPGETGFVRLSCDDLTIPGQAISVTWNQNLPKQTEVIATSINPGDNNGRVDFVNESNEVDNVDATVLCLTLLEEPPS